LHLTIEYQYTKKSIQDELKQISKTFHPAIQTALWELNSEQLQSIVDGMMKIPLVYGVQVFDSSHKQIINQFQNAISNEKIDNLEYFNQFSIHYQMNGKDIYLADVKIYSADNAVYQRLKVGYAMILLNAAIKATVLVFLFFIAFRKYLEQPLQDLTNTIVNLRIENAKERHVFLDMKYDNELKVLQEEFNRLLDKISREEIKRFELLQSVNEKLEFEVEKRTKELEYIATTDRLTKLYNRTKMDTELEKLYELYKRYGRIFSVIMIDIDNFKIVNDTYGHQVGDIILEQFASILKQHIRKTDFVGRWGGEEFLIACPETSQEDTYKLAQNLRIEVEQFIFDKVKHKTMSVGVAEMQEGVTLDNLISNADKAMYQAKENGRNQVVLSAK
jgi:diguanylate cyclase (GGDEF)-like protein